MRLLICTQVLDRNDPYLGFMHGWFEELARNVESLTIICLKEGEHSLPANVHIYSLGKEKVPAPQGAMIYHGTLRRLKYATLFYRYIWRVRAKHDAVFVHMNQEYILLGGWFWLLARKRIYLWRNHYSGSIFTDIAAQFCTKVFCTSRYSYTAKYKKTVLMPIGVDPRFVPPHIPPAPGSVLFFGRLAPSKRPALLLLALAKLGREQWAADFYGPGEDSYIAALKQEAAPLGERVRFLGPVPHHEAPQVFGAHAIYVNLGGSGMYDKTIFEAAASGCLVLAASEDFAKLVDQRFTFKQDDAEDLAQKLRALLTMPKEEKHILQNGLSQLAKTQGLQKLIGRLVEEMQ